MKAVRLFALVLSLLTVLLSPFVFAASKDDKKSASSASSSAAASASAASDLDESLPPEIIKLEKSFDYKQGKITIGDNLATLNVPETWRFLDADGAERLLVEGWGNPPGGIKPLGMLVPAGVSPLAAESWGVVITYLDEGYVEDEDAESINYDELLKSMKEATIEENKERARQGFPAIELVGWAEAPRYDKTSNKLYWAQELSFDGSTEHTLNYDIRALGRSGVLSMNAVATMEQMQTVKDEMPRVLGFVEFNQGKRYADFKPGVDKVAAYGLGALVAGKVAAKVGFFKLIIVALLGAKKFLIFGAIALGALLIRFFRSKSQQG